MAEGLERKTMEAKDTLQFIVDRYKIDLSQPNPIKVDVSRWHDIGHLLNDLKFEKGVEIGVYKGVFTQTLARRAPNMKLYAVDAWTTYEGYKDYPPGDLELIGYPQAVERASRYPNVELVKGWSKDVAPTFADASLDFMFLDANHTYPCVKEDLELWVKKIKPGGIVMGHDYFSTKGRSKLEFLDFGVIEAVNEWVTDHKVKNLFTTSDGFASWWFIAGDTE